MINDLLDLTRIEQGRVKLDLEPVPVSALLDEATSRFRSVAQSRGIMLLADEEHDHLSVMVDRDRIEHVFDNLIANAIQHTGAGGSIHLRATADGEFARFAVVDTGEGIPAEELPRIFDKFYRIATSRHSGGAGLGLAIVREIIAAHGGQIDVASEPGNGTTFTFTLPTGEQDLAGSSAGGNQWTNRSAS
jgi:signal transduction histidine kinase